MRVLFVSLLALIATIAGLARAAKHTYVTGQVNVTGTDVIFAATLTGDGLNDYLAQTTGSTAPHSIDIPAGTTSLTVNVTGPGLSIWSEGYVATADGTNPIGFVSRCIGVNAISGISVNAAAYLSGVFVNTNHTVSSMMMPPALDYTQSGTQFMNFAPHRGMLFFIGDGLTGDGTGETQRFWVPPHANKLFLGVADCQGGTGVPSIYYDNGGLLTVDYSIKVMTRTEN
jgi:hypothetical protein